MDSELQKHNQVRGYLEGYYGKLLSWSDRKELVVCLASVNHNTYCYAPKEDVRHRLHWREPYNSQWLKSLAQFCEFSADTGISVITGIAPGLDFDFEQAAGDFDFLYGKAIDFLDNGSSEILILWDDIDGEYYTPLDSLSEGAAHARVVNQLSEKLGRRLWTTPRVYAADIDNTNNYLQDFFTELAPEHTVLLCGNAIVPENVSQLDLAKLCQSANNTDTPAHRVILWDNFYANDYCPRRLFLGPWTGREEIGEYLINPTGMPKTDQLLLDVVSATHTAHDRHKELKNVYKRHGVPDAFEAIAGYFSKPAFGDESLNEHEAECIEPAKIVEQAIEVCLWKWKSPLAREWYPYIMGLKHDLAIAGGVLPRDRVLKTQPGCLAARLLVRDA